MAPAIRLDSTEIDRSEDFRVLRRPAGHTGVAEDEAEGREEAEIRRDGERSGGDGLMLFARTSMRAARGGVGAGLIAGREEARVEGVVEGREVAAVAREALQEVDRREVPTAGQARVERPMGLPPAGPGGGAGRRTSRPTYDLRLVTSKYLAPEGDVLAPKGEQVGRPCARRSCR